MLLLKRPPKLQPDQMRWSLQVPQGVAAAGVSLNYQGPLCYVMLRTGGSWLSICSLSSIDCWLQNLNNFQSSVLQLVAPVFFFTCFFPHAPPVAWIGRFSKPWKPERLYLRRLLLSAFYSYSLQNSIFNKKERREGRSLFVTLQPVIKSKELFYLPYASFCWQSWHKVVLLTRKIFSQDVFSAHARFLAFFVQVLLRSATPAATILYYLLGIGPKLAAWGSLKWFFAQYSEPSCINALIFIQRRSRTDSDNSQLKTTRAQLTTAKHCSTCRAAMLSKIFAVVFNSAFQILSKSRAIVSH